MTHIASHIPRWLALPLLLIILGIFLFEIFRGAKYGVVTKAGKPCRQSENPEMFWFLFVLNCVCVGGILYLLGARYIFGVEP